MILSAVVGIENCILLATEKYRNAFGLSFIYEEKKNHY